MIFVLRNSIDGVAMSTVTVSPKYQIVIPKDIREKMGIEPGQKLSFTVLDGVIHLVAIPSIEEMEGFAEGMDTHIEKEEDRF